MIEKAIIIEQQNILDADLKNECWWIGPKIIDFAAFQFKKLLQILSKLRRSIWVWQPTKVDNRDNGKS